MNTNKTHNENCFIFDRVSTLEQEMTGLSLEFQGDYAVTYAKNNNLIPVKIFSISETAYVKDKRKQFNEMLRLAKELEIKHIIFKHPNRLSRNFHDLLQIQELIENDGLHLHFWEYTSLKFQNTFSTFQS